MSIPPAIWSIFILRHFQGHLNTSEHLGKELILSLLQFGLTWAGKIWSGMIRVHCSSDPSTDSVNSVSKPVKVLLDRPRIHCNSDHIWTGNFVSKAVRFYRNSCKSLLYPEHLGSCKFALKILKIIFPCMDIIANHLQSTLDPA